MQLPKTLLSFQALRGTYGRMNVTALTSKTVELRLTDEFVELTREDATAMIRAFTDWLAATGTQTTVVRTHGATSEVVVVDDGPGQPGVTVLDDDRIPAVRRRDRVDETGVEAWGPPRRPPA